MVNKGLRCFFLVNGKRVKRLPQHFASLKKKHLGREKNCWFRNCQRKKKRNFVFGCLLLQNENKMRKFQTKTRLFLKSKKRAHIAQSFFGNRLWYCFISAKKTWKRRNAWKRERLCNVGKPTGSKTLSWDLLFFSPLYWFCRKRSSHFKLVVQHVKMKPAKRLS